MTLHQMGALFLWLCMYLSVLNFWPAKLTVCVWTVRCQIGGWNMRFYRVMTLHFTFSYPDIHMTVTPLSQSKSFSRFVQCGLLFKMLSAKCIVQLKDAGNTNLKGTSKIASANLPILAKRKGLRSRVSQLNNWAESSLVRHSGTKLMKEKKKV